MTSEQNKVIARRFFEASEVELLAPDIVVHFPGAPGPLNREALLQEVSMFNAAFSDRLIMVEDQIAEGDKVATRVTLQAIHSLGDFLGHPPTGKQIAIGAIIVQRIKEGKIVEHWPLFDMMGLMQQLSLVPPPQPTR